MPKRTPGPGRPNKGQRELFVTRVAKPVADALRAHAEELDVTYSDYVAGVLARALDLPEHAPVSLNRAQVELPLKSA